MPLTSTDVSVERIERLRALFPEAFAEGKIDLDRLKDALGEEIDERRERYGLSWAGKADAIRAIQVPSVGTLIPCPEESVDFDTSGNLFIEGDNLEVLKLLQKSYHGRVKMIYIDPPYNTGNEFIYPDNFRDGLQEYLRFTGQVDEEGTKLSTNRETSGRYHSNWLSMMYPRLFLARNLLRDDGVIFVSIDDHEVHNLRLLMNEIFGEENCVGNIVIQSNPRGRHLETFIATSHESILIYSKHIDYASINKAPLTNKQIEEYSIEDEDGHYRLLGLRKRGAFSRREDRPNLHYPIFCNAETKEVDIEFHPGWIKVLPRLSDGADGVWRWSKEKVRKDSELLLCKIVKGREEWDIFQKDYMHSGDSETPGRKYKSMWYDSAVNYENGKREIRKLFNDSVFDTTKPLALIERLIQMGSTKDGIVLDFFSGSSTAAHATLKINQQDGGNRKFIMVQLPEVLQNNSPGFKAGFNTIADIGKERICRVIKRTKDGEEGEAISRSGTPRKLPRTGKGWPNS